MFVQDLHEGVRKHKPVHKLYNKVAESLMEACKELKLTTEIPEIRKDVELTNKRWENLNEELKEKSKKLSSYKQGTFYECGVSVSITENVLSQNPHTSGLTSLKYDTTY